MLDDGDTITCKKMCRVDLESGDTKFGLDLAMVTR